MLSCNAHLAKLITLACCCAREALGAVDADAVTSLPGFSAKFPMRVYSGFLDVTFDPPIGGYDGASIHYQQVCLHWTVEGISWRRASLF